jgi:hypothetical protein
MSADRGFGITWSDIGLTLFTAICFSVAYAAFAGMKLPTALDSLKTVNAGPIFAAIGLTGTAVLSLLNRRVPILSLIAALILCYFFVMAIKGAQPYFRPIPSEHWATTEGIGSTLHSDWDVTFDGEPFDCPPVAGMGIHSFTCRAFGWGLFRAINRDHAGDGNTCTFVVQLSSPTGNDYTGSYHCHNGGPYPFTATVSHNN